MPFQSLQTFTRAEIIQYLVLKFFEDFFINHELHKGLQNVFENHNLNHVNGMKVPYQSLRNSIFNVNFFIIDHIHYFITILYSTHKILFELKLNYFLFLCQLLFRSKVEYTTIPEFPYLQCFIIRSGY